MAETDSNSDPSGRTVARKLTISLAEAADVMGLRVSYLRELVKEGKVPWTRVGKVSVGFTQEDIDGTLAALAVKPRNGRDPQSLTSSRAKKRAA